MKCACVALLCRRASPHKHVSVSEWEGLSAPALASVVTKAESIAEIVELEAARAKSDPTSVPYFTAVPSMSDDDAGVCVRACLYACLYLFVCMRA